MQAPRVSATCSRLDTNTVYSDDKKISQYPRRRVRLRFHTHYNKGAKDALENISFTAEPGEIIGVIGGTGGNKAALVGLIPRFYDASSGTIRVDGRNSQFLFA
ncbi:ATP-binding cassette domain-containing protein [Hominenteromicrobium sp.]|uniref:ATP-binding cassette domain-containing protein n=1 Tax=Hominenteromicrobium sp. TaxID=3073581 RepID=UPI00399B2DDB